MSRVADALRAARRDFVGDAYKVEGHPWGEDLGGTDHRRGSDVNAATAHEDAEDSVPETARLLRAAERARQTDIVSATSPLADVDPGIRGQIAGLVERVFLPSSGEAPRVTAFAGIDGDPRSGWIAAAVADMLTQRTAVRAAVVDLNFDNPQVGEYFSINGSHGSLAALGSDAAFAKTAHQVRTNLWAIPADRHQAPLELPASLRARISRLATVYDHVILSLEPLARWSGGGLPAMADGIVLVIAADATRREAARQLTERLQASGAVVLGAVLTNRRYAIPDAIYRRL